ncbi:unnamed protein product [Diamesa tonsa]
MNENGYKYWLAYRKQQTSYYRCARFKTGCMGRCIVENGKIKNKRSHNHAKESNKVLIDNFRKKLVQRVINEPNSDIYKVYVEEAATQHTDASLLYNFNQAQSNMRKARKTARLKQQPKETETIINELKDLRSESSINRCTLRSMDIFYQATIEIGSESICVFYHRQSKEILSSRFTTIEELHIDCSLKCSQNNLNSPIFLLTVHAVVKNNNYPIIFGLLNSKEHYSAIFCYIRDQFPIFVPNCCIVTNNNDSNLKQSLLETWPEATIKYFWFHYADDIMNYVKDNNLTSEMTRKGISHNCLKMLLLLPLLPANYISPGLDSLRKWCVEKSCYTEFLKGLFDHVEKFLKLSEKISIFNNANCILTNVHHFNKNLLNDKSELSLSDLLQQITKSAGKTHKRLLNPSQKMKNIKLLNIIEHLSHNWIKNSIHLRRPLQFLQIIASTNAITDSLIHFVSTYHDTETKLPELQSFEVHNDFPTSAEVTSEFQASHLIPSTFSSEPPPLAYFPIKKVTRTEPPPLILIQKCSTLPINSN